MRTLVALALLVVPSGLFAQEAPDTLKVKTIKVTPEQATLRVLEKVEFTAVAYDSLDQAMPEIKPLWLVNPFDVASTDTSDFFAEIRGPKVTVRGNGPGLAVVVAVVGKVIGRATLSVQPLGSQKIELAIRDRQLVEGSYLRLGARVLDEVGNPLWKAQVSWTSSDPKVALVEADQLLARRPGKVTLTATSEAATASLDVQVLKTPAKDWGIKVSANPVRTGDIIRLQVTGGGAPLPHLWPRWLVDRPGAWVEEDGAFVAEMPGDYLVLAQVGDRIKTATIRVEPRQARARLSLVGRAPITKGHAGELWVFDHYAYVTTLLGNNKLYAYDVADPKNPMLTDSVEVDARIIDDVQVDQGLKVAVLTREGASSRRNGIVLLNIQDPAHPKVLSEYTETVTGGVHNTFIYQGHVFLTNDGTRDLHVIDIRDSRHPREVARWGVSRPGRYLHDVFIKDGLAYLSYWDDGLVILDVGNGLKGGSPANPQFVSQYQYPAGNTHTAFRYKDYVFVGDEVFPADWNPEAPIEARGYFHVLDVRDVEHPVEVARYEVPEAGAHNCWVEGDVLYIGYYQGGVRAVDISGELRGDLYRQGRELAFFRTEAPKDAALPNATFAWGAQLHHGLIYAADFNSGLWILKLEREGQ